MSSETKNPSRIERLLAYASLSIIAVALLSFFVTLIVGMSNRQALADGLWPFVYGVSAYGLPIGFVLLIALLITSQVRRRREFRQNQKR